MESTVCISTARRKIMGTIEVNGVKHEVHQLTFGINQSINAAEGTARALVAVQDAVREVCPTLPEETLAAMSLDDGQVVLLFAGAGVRAVEAMFPNAVSPETPISAD
jgi:hypothetical protein